MHAGRPSRGCKRKGHHDELEIGTGRFCGFHPGNLRAGGSHSAGRSGNHSRRARRAAAGAPRAPGGASGLRLGQRPLRLAAPPIRLDARTLRTRAPRSRTGPGSLGAARGSLRLAQRRMALAPLKRSGVRPRVFGIRHRSLLAGLFATLTVVSSNRASADEPKPLAPAAEKRAPQEMAKPVPKARLQPVGVDLNRLGIQLDLFAAEAHRNRLATTFTGIGMAGALIPTGIILLKRTDGVSQAVVIGMIVGGAGQLLSVLAGFIPTRMDKVRE